MDSLPPIPTPPAQRWREFRIQVLPVLTFSTVLVGLVMMWHAFVMPASIIGTVDGIIYNVSANADGILTELAVDRFSTVSNQQHLGLVTVMDKDLLEASMSAVESELRVMKVRMDLDRTRNLDSLVRLKLALHNEKQALAMAENNRQQKESEYARVSKLNQSGVLSNVVSDAEIEIALRDVNIVKAEIEHKKKIIAQYEQEIAGMEQLGQTQIPAKDLAIEKDIEAQRKKLLEESKPTHLKAPCAGKVNMVFKRAGERVVSGEPIISIVAPMSDRVIGYVRQPLNQLPTTNDIVMVRTRAQKRTAIQGQILEVGPSMIPLDPTMLSPDTRRREVGLPILIKLPPNQLLTPGEFVDISIQYAKR